LEVKSGGRRAMEGAEQRAEWIFDRVGVRRGEEERSK
jgi:hypothetical protein